VANLQIKGIQDDLYEEIKRLASAENRSVSQEVLYLVRDYLAKRKRATMLQTPAEVLLQLSGSWKDDRSAEEIIADVRGARQNSPRLSDGF
jgi:hypothetical protein